MKIKLELAVGILAAVVGINILAAILRGFEVLTVNQLKACIATSLVTAVVVCVAFLIWGERPPHQEDPL